MRSQVWWYTARSGGIVAWALASLAVIGGLQLSTRLVRKPAPNWVLDVHRFLAALSVVFVGVHVVGLAADSFIDFGPADIFVPFVSSYKPAAVALGIVGMYLLVAIELTSLAMRKIPRRTWHAVHLTSFVVFVVATVHGLTAGTDRNEPIFQWACVLAAGVVLLMTLVRILSPRKVPRGFGYRRRIRREGGVTRHRRRAVRTTHQQALRLEYATVAWNVGEVIVTIGLGATARSLALVAFGLDSVVEIFASSVVLWNLRGRPDPARTRRALRLVSFAFFALAVTLAVGGVWTLAGEHHPDQSVAGILYLAATAIVMFALARAKQRVSTSIGNHPLADEARITYLDGVLASSILVALVTNAVFGWWWADPLAAILVAVAAFGEGVVAPREH